MSDSASYRRVTGELDLIDRREILRTWQNVCIGISCPQCQFYNDDAMSGDCLLERWVHSLPSAQPERKKGEWIVKTDCEGKTRTCICGLCGYETGKYTWENPNYCPDCGSYNGGEQDDSV